MTMTVALRVVTDARVLVGLVFAMLAGLWGTSMWPWPTNDALLGLIASERPHLAACLAYTYTTLWFTSPFVASSVVLSALTIFSPRPRTGPVTSHLPEYPDPKTRSSLSLVLGEQHHRAAPAPAA